MYLLISFYLLNFSLLTFSLSIKFLIMKFNLLIQWNIFYLLSYKINFIFFFDWMTFTFISVVYLISSMVILYSMEYMKSNKFIKRFMFLITIFFISMMMMIISPNIFSILLGWDGLGLSSYCLIIFYQNKKSYNSGMVTLLMNRIGDINLLILISLMINQYSFNLMFNKNINFMMMMIVLLIAMTKSAQIPFSIWLPMAMAAPTPVSSLVHSSTLVTAGVYLLIRFTHLLNNNLLHMLMFISLFTMMLASTSALFEYDIKKIIALSTLSQLSLMFLTISFHLPILSFFHLITHAMFKSLLFLCSGIMIHNYFNLQDIRVMSLMNKNLPLTNMIFNIASLTLSGMPFLSGFYSKDFIIEMYFMNNMNFFIYYLMLMSTMLTLMYSLRLMFYLSIKIYPLKMFNKLNINNFMNLSIYLLFFMTMTYGSMMNWLLFNSLNLIILPNLLKTLIFYLLMFSMIILMIMMKFNKLNLKYYYFMNYMWLFQINLKKSKFMMFKNNNKLVKIKDMGWLEILSSKLMLFYIKKINLYKNNLNIKISVMLIMLMNLLIIMHMFK